MFPVLDSLRKEIIGFLYQQTVSEIPCTDSASIIVRIVLSLACNNYMKIIDYVVLTTVFLRPLYLFHAKSVFLSVLF